MSRRRSRWRELLLCFVLQGGVLLGVPMRPDEIRQLMKSLSGTVIEHVVKDDDSGDGGGDDPPPASGTSHASSGGQVQNRFRSP
jgi:hypothetical protein